MHNEPNIMKEDGMGRACSSSVREVLVEKTGGQGPLKRHAHGS
jgi:hypothetical protein